MLFLGLPKTLQTLSTFHPMACGERRLTCNPLRSADAKHHWGIHREAPPFVEQSTAQEILVTGIKVWPAVPAYTRMTHSEFSAFATGAVSFARWPTSVPPRSTAADWQRRLRM